MNRTAYAKLLTLSALLLPGLTAPAIAQTPGPDYVATKFDLYTATSDLWRTDHGFQSTIRLKNMLDVTAIDATLTLYMADGTPYPLPTVHLDKSSVVTVNINSALASAPASIASHISQNGSATLQYRYDWSGAVLGTISVLDTVRSLQYLGRFIFPDSMPGITMQSASSTPGTTNVTQGMWWKYTASSSVFLSVVNPNTTPTQADISVVDSQGLSLGTRHIALPPRASTITYLDDLLGKSTIGGLQISYPGSMHDVLYFGGLEDDAAGYSAKVSLAMMEDSVPIQTGAASTCTVASPGIMIGAPDPMEGFPPTIKFSPYGYARNTNSSAVTLHALANYMDENGPHSVPMPDISLPPGAALNLNLAKNARVPLQNGMLNVQFTYTAACGSVLLTTGSVDSSGSYVFEVDPQGVGKTWGHTSQFWQVGAGTDSMYSIWNPTAQPQDLRVTIQYGAGSVYQYTLHLDANASAMISIMDLMRSGKPDASGRIIPSTASMGSLTVGGIGTDMRNVVTFVMSSGTYNPVAGTCCQGYQTCNGATGCTVTQVSFTVAIGSDVAEVFMCSANGGGQTNYTGSAAWNSSAPSIITVTTGNAEGMEPGQSTIGAQISLPPYIPQYCLGNGNCPTGSNFGNNASGTVNPTLSSSTSLWYFGPNISPPASFTLGATNTTITANNASGGAYAWSITNGSSKASFSSSGLQSSSTTSANSVKLYSANYSTAANDVTVSLTWTDSQNVTHSAVTIPLSIDAPYLLAAGTPQDAGVTNCNNPATRGTAGWQSLIPYTIKSFFGQTVNNIYVNETLAVPFQNNIPNNWGATPAGVFLVTMAGAFTDNMCIVNGNPPFNPKPVVPGSPLSTQEVQYDNQGWYVGGQTTGTGIEVQSDVQLWYLDHGRHGNIQTGPGMR